MESTQFVDVIYGMLLYKHVCPYVYMCNSIPEDAYMCTCARAQ